MSYRNDIVPGLILAVSSIIYFAFTFQIDVFKGTGATPLDSRSMPRIWAALLLILSLRLVYRGLKGKKLAELNKSEVTKTKNIKEFLLDNREIVLTFLFLAIYIIGLKYIGFLIMTIVYLFFQISILTNKNERKYKNIVIVSTLAAVFINYLFVTWLNVMLPKGILGF